jgi:hypothetical protein
MLYVCADVCCVLPMLPKSIRCGTYKHICIHIPLASHYYCPYCLTQPRSHTRDTTHHTHTHTYTHTHTPTHTHTHTHLHTHTHTHIHLHAHTHSHTHTQPLTRPRDDWHTLGARWKILKKSEFRAYQRAQR